MQSPAVLVDRLARKNRTGHKADNPALKYKGDLTQLNA